MKKEIKVAMIGYGGIAKSHKQAYEVHEKNGTPIKLVAICDIDERRFHTASNINIGSSGVLDLTGIKTYTDVDKMLAEVDFDMADICIPSYLHKDMAIKMMRAGKAVLSEKPMSTSSKDCDEMLAVAKECNSVFMIGQVLRFDPNYLFLKDCIDTNKFGKLKNLFMERRSAYPTWGWQNWFASTEKSGGMILDLHIHDIDMARFLLGEPKAVSAVAYDGISRWQVVDSRLFYDDLTVIATGTWDEAPTAPFVAGFRARFENASVIYRDFALTVYPNEGEPYKPQLVIANNMIAETRALAEMAADRSATCPNNTPESARNSVCLIEKLRESADKGGARVEIDY